MHVDVDVDVDEDEEDGFSSSAHVNDAEAAAGALPRSPKNVMDVPPPTGATEGTTSMP